MAFTGLSFIRSVGSGGILSSFSLSHIQVLEAKGHHYQWGVAGLPENSVRCLITCTSLILQLQATLSFISN